MFSTHNTLKNTFSLVFKQCSFKPCKFWDGLKFGTVADCTKCAKLNPVLNLITLQYLVLKLSKKFLRGSLGVEVWLGGSRYPRTPRAQVWICLY